jgi:predicted dehydrogenase
MKEIGIGVIGYGFMGKMHTYGYKTIPLYYTNLPYKIKLKGICDTVPGVAESAREQQGFEFATTDPDEIIGNEQIHVVSVCTPNVFHKDLVIKALKAGKHVYCDKPLTSNLNESREVLDVLGKTKGQVTQMALQLRFYPATLLAKKLIEEGKIGRPYLFRTSYLHSSGTNPMKTLSWKQDKKFGGGGVLLDLGSHAFDLMYHLLGEYKSVYTVLNIAYDKRPDKDGVMVKVEGEDTSITMVKMKSGTPGVIEASKVATGTNDELRFEIHGEKGALRFNSMDPGYLELYDNTAKEQSYGGGKGYMRIDCMQKYDKPGGGFPNPKFTLGFVRAHVHSLFNFIDHIDKKTESAPSFSEGAYIQKVMEKCYLSAGENRWTDVD